MQEPLKHDQTYHFSRNWTRRHVLRLKGSKHDRLVSPHETKTRLNKAKITVGTVERLELSMASGSPSCDLRRKIVHISKFRVIHKLL